jgi:plasmid stabilization system protein ParE
MNTFKVQWSERAKSEFADLLTYLDKSYGADVALRVLEKTEQLTDSLCNFPLAFPISDKFSGVRKAVITKQSSLLYVVRSNTVRILHIWDNRQDI